MSATAEVGPCGPPDLVAAPGGFTITCESFALRHSSDRPDHVDLHIGSWIQPFLVPSSCDPMDGPDVTGALLSLSVEERDDAVLLRFDYPSSAWEQKSCFVEVARDRVEYWYRVQGQGAVDTLRYFEAARPETMRPQFLAAKHLNDGRQSPYRDVSQGSPARFSTVFTPEPNAYGRQLVESYESAQVSVNADLDYAGGNFQFNPGLLCFVLGQTEDGPWLVAGLAVAPGAYRFSELEYVGGRQFGLNLNYWGATEVEGWFETPHVVLRPADSPLGGCRAYVDHLRSSGLVDQDTRERHRWWAGPVVDGWGHQCYMADLFRTRSPSDRPQDHAAYFMSTQAHYEDLVERLERRDLPWNVLTVNARWSLFAGLKEVDTGRWPDMRGFVDGCHDRGKRVLLWWSPWDTEGVPPEQCIRYSEDTLGGKRNRPGRTSRFRPMVEGAALAPDVTLPVVRERIHDQVRRTLGHGEGAWDFDGLRVDHVGVTPGMYGLVFPKRSRRLVGIELLRCYHDLLYATAKEARPDALILAQSPNPYFTNCIDMQTIGDLYSPDGTSVNDHAELRARLIGAANPDWLVEMHGWPLPNVAAMYDYVGLQCRWGVPTLYYLSHLDTTGEPLPDELFDVLGRQWTVYCAEHGL